MTFDKILDDGRLWAVRFDGEEDNALQIVFNQWNDPEWLWDFFTENLSDLESYFKITDVDQAIFDTMEDGGELECLILDISPEANLDLTGGAIKLTRTMQEREHTLRELSKMEQVRNLLLEQGVVDVDGFEDYTNELYL
jgi:hypothetical protein